MFLLRLVIQSHRQKVTTGEEGLIGKVGTVRTDIGPRGGKVFVYGELWQAISDVPISEGSQVHVRRVENFYLVVEPVADRS
jgi:membrane-bound serine protease (ClpP class)